jgi:putative transcriptional regulator
MNSLKSHLLVASPSLLTPFFSRTVILMLQHTEEGAMGVVLNRPTEATITDISEQVLQEHFESDKPIHLGGPVPGPLMAIHTLEGLADQEIFAGVYTSIEASKVQQLIREQAEPSLIVANYAGWGPGQLEGEIEEDSWLSCLATQDHVFWAAGQDLWTAVVKKINASKLPEFLGLKGMPEDPNLN